MLDRKVGRDIAEESHERNAAFGPEAAHRVAVSREEVAGAERGHDEPDRVCGRLPEVFQAIGVSKVDDDDVRAEGLERLEHLQGVLLEGITFACSYECE